MTLARWAGHAPGFAFTALVTLVLELSVGEFVVLQRLPPDQIRERFDLPASCKPNVSAVRGIRTSVIVMITCPDDDAPETEEDGAAGAQ